MYHFLLTKFGSMFTSYSHSKINSASLLAKHRSIDYPYYVLLPIMCTSNLDPSVIFLYSLKSKHIKK